MLLAALQGYIGRLSAILTVNISTDVSTEETYKKILYFTNMAAYWSRLQKPKKSVHKINQKIGWYTILSKKLIDVLKNLPILPVTSSTVLSLRCQSEVYWLLKQIILLFCGLQNLNIKRLFVNSEYHYTWQSVSEVSVKSRCTANYIGHYKYISVATLTENQLWHWLLVSWVSVEYQLSVNQVTTDVSSDVLTDTLVNMPIEASHKIHDPKF